MHKFRTTQRALSIVSGLGGILIVIGGVTALALSGKDTPAALAAGGVIALSGLTIVIICQLALAQIETANNTAAIRDLMHRQIEIMGRKPPSSDTAPFDSTASDAPQVYNGVPITKTPRGYMAGGEIYYSLADAKSAIDRA